MSCRRCYGVVVEGKVSFWEEKMLSMVRNRELRRGREQGEF